jgi:hypothetical protein
MAMVLKSETGKQIHLLSDQHTNIEHSGSSQREPHGGP